jgi:hypothetical protein
MIAGYAEQAVCASRVVNLDNGTQAEIPPSTRPVLGMIENLPVEPDCEVYTTNIPTMVRRLIEDKANITHQNHNDNDGDQNTGHRNHYMLF